MDQFEVIAALRVFGIDVFNHLLLPFIDHIVHLHTLSLIHPHRWNGAADHDHTNGELSKWTTLLFLGRRRIGIAHL